MKNRIDKIFIEQDGKIENVTLKEAVRQTVRQFAAELIMHYEHPSIVDISAAYEVVDKFIKEQEND